VCGWRAKVRPVATKAFRPDAEEIARNPRARSARLRIVERLDVEAR
jgi:16S rRNA (cytosine1402-N4)-methyltransferase